MFVYSKPPVDSDSSAEPAARLAKRPRVICRLEFGAHSVLRLTQDARTLPASERALAGDDCARGAFGSFLMPPQLPAPVPEAEPAPASAVDTPVDDDDDDDEFVIVSDEDPKAEEIRQRLRRSSRRGSVAP